MDPTRLRREFDGTDAEVRVVARQAGDLLESGRLEADRGRGLTAAELLGHLRDAPDGSDLIERWNWWMGALEIAYGGYEQFTVNSDPSETNA